MSSRYASWRRRFDGVEREAVIVAPSATTPLTTVLLIPENRIYVKSIKLVPSAAVNGDDTDNFTFAISNTSGNMVSHEHATASTWAAKAVVNLGAVSYPAVSADDPIILTKSTKGTGLATPGMQVLIEYLVLG